MHTLKKARLEHGLSQHALSRLSGVHFGTIRNIERNRTRISELSAFRLAGPLGIKPEALLEEGKKETATTR